MDIDALKAKGDAALAQISNALDDLQYSPDQRPVPLLRLAMDYVRDIIAELGQEVGAVAMPLTDDEHEWLMYAVDHMLDDSEPEDKTCARVLQGLLDRCVVTSPAHTSEARDWEGVEHVASHIENAVEYITKQYPDARMLDRAPIMRNMRRWARNLRAAMRQEGGNG